MIKNKPKKFNTELHEHLGGSSTPEFLWELAQDQGIRLDEKDFWNFIKSVTIANITTQKSYHQLYDLIQLIQSTPYGVEKSVHHAISNSYRNHFVDTLELRFNPMRRNRGGEHDLDKVILAALTGLKKATIEYPIKAGLIIELDRRFDLVRNTILCEKAIKYVSQGVIGIDVSGPSSSGFNVRDFIPLFAKARSNGLGLTFHTGEFTDDVEVREVIELVHPHRIGHGIAAYKNENLMDLLVKTHTVLEICPTSNIMTQVVASWDQMKEILTKFLEKKVQFAICSDSPEFFATSTQKEILNLVNRGIISESHADYATKIAAKSTFLNNDYLTNIDRKEQHDKNFYY